MNKVIFILSYLFLLPLIVFSQQARKTKPTGKEIADVVKKYKLKEKSTFELQGKKIHFTPAVILDSNDQSLKDGFFLGVLENEIAGDETGLPPGRYNLYYTVTCDNCKPGTEKRHVYAESKGQIVAEALRVEWVKNENKDGKAVEFIPKGWGFFYFYDYYGSSYYGTSTTTGGGSTTGTTTIYGCPPNCTLRYYW